MDGKGCETAMTVIHASSHLSCCLRPPARLLWTLVSTIHAGVRGVRHCGDNIAQDPSTSGPAPLRASITTAITNSSSCTGRWPTRKHTNVAALISRFSVDVDWDHRVESDPCLTGGAFETPPSGRPATPGLRTPVYFSRWKLIGVESIALGFSCFPPAPKSRLRWEHPLDSRQAGCERDSCVIKSLHPSRGAWKSDNIPAQSQKVEASVSTVNTFGDVGWRC